jgi:hypothetical protein
VVLVAKAVAKAEMSLMLLKPRLPRDSISNYVECQPMCFDSDSQLHRTYPQRYITQKEQQLTSAL